MDHNNRRAACCTTSTWLVVSFRLACACAFALRPGGDPHQRAARNGRSHPVRVRHGEPCFPSDVGRRRTIPRTTCKTRRIFTSPRPESSTCHRGYGTEVGRERIRASTDHLESAERRARTVCTPHIAAGAIDARPPRKHTRGSAGPSLESPRSSPWPGAGVPRPTGRIAANEVSFLRVEARVVLSPPREPPAIHH